MQKVLIISNKDSIWLIPSWKKVVKKFSKDINFVEIIYLPEKLKNFNFFQSIIYYLNMFGLFSFTLLSLFSIKRIFKNYFNKIPEFEEIDKTSLDYFSVKAIKEIVDEKKPNIVFISCSYIIPNELLQIKGVKWINKHASLLPETRGIFPYIWNVILERKQGISFHEVSDTIDTGDVIYQEEIKNSTSMTDFYKKIYDNFDKYFELFLLNYSTQNLKQNKEKNYYSLPTKDDMKKFKRNSGKIIQIKDLFEK